jgi:hypothetical protein
MRLLRLWFDREKNLVSPHMLFDFLAYVFMTLSSEIENLHWGMNDFGKIEKINLINLHWGINDFNKIVKKQLI